MSESLGTVIITGAGPTGMTAALELARFGIPVRLLEKTPAPATTSRAVGVQPRTLELFEQRGLAAELVDLGNRSPGASIFSNGKRVFRLNFAEVDSRYNYVLYVSQAETERVLREALERAGVPIERNVTLVAFAQGGDVAGVSAVVQYADGRLEKIEGAYLIDAEGAHSTARTTLGLNFEGKSLLEEYALGDLFADGELVETDLHVFSSAFGFMGLFPMGDRRFRLIASNPITKPSKSTEPSLEELQQIYDQRSHIPARFRDLSWSSWFRINSRMIHKLNVGRVFLGGDSAHIHSPAGAQGMNTGIQDMINLGWKLALVIRGEAKPEILDTYTADRVPVIKNVLEKTEGLTQTIGSENALFRSVFDHIAPWVASTQAFGHNATERMSQLAVGYRESPLSVSEHRSGSLHAGDRIPDLPVTVLNREGTAERQPHVARVFDLLHPSKFTVFFSNLTGAAKTHAAFHDTFGAWKHLIQAHEIAPAGRDPDFVRLFGTSSSIVMIRPDGYLAFTGSENAIARLQTYCDRWLVPQAQPVEKAARNA